MTSIPPPTSLPFIYIITGIGLLLLFYGLVYRYVWSFQQNPCKLGWSSILMSKSVIKMNIVLDTWLCANGVYFLKWFCTWWNTFWRKEAITLVKWYLSGYWNSKQHFEYTLTWSLSFYGVQHEHLCFIRQIADIDWHYSSCNAFTFLSNWVIWQS